jgi:hypothetical protein
MEAQKISEMVLDFAGEFLRLGETPDKRRSLLSGACSAWNIACAPVEAKAELLDQFMANYRLCNPGANAEQYRGIRQDMELLIQQKMKKYPEVIKQIVSCDLTVVDGKDHVVVLSVRPKGPQLLTISGPPGRYLKSLDRGGVFEFLCPSRLTSKRWKRTWNVGLDRGRGLMPIFQPARRSSK